MTLFVVSVSLALLISAICSLMEATLLSMTPSQVADLAHRQPKTGAIWQRFKANIQPPIAAILFLNTAAHTIGASVAGSQFDELYGDEWILAFSLVFTFVMLQFTEILPKTLGVRYNREIAHFIARPLNAMVVGMTPLLRVIHWINRPFEGRKGQAGTFGHPGGNHRPGGTRSAFESDQSVPGADYSRGFTVIATVGRADHDSGRASEFALHDAHTRRSRRRGAYGSAHTISRVRGRES